MKLEFRPEGKKGFCLRLPTRLLLNPLTALFLPHLLKQRAGHKFLTVRQCMKLIRGVYRAKKHLGGTWEFFSVLTHDRTRISLHP